MQNCKRRENYEKEKPISCADAGNSSVHVNGCMRKQRRRQWDIQRSRRGGGCGRRKRRSRGCGCRSACRAGRGRSVCGCAGEHENDHQSWCANGHGDGYGGQHQRPGAERGERYDDGYELHLWSAADEHGYDGGCRWSRKHDHNDVCWEYRRWLYGLHEQRQRLAVSGNFPDGCGSVWFQCGHGTLSERRL